MSADQTEEQRAAYVAALEVELKKYQEKGRADRVADVEAELARVGVSGRSGKKSTRLKGEGRPA